MSTVLQGLNCPEAELDRKLTMKQWKETLYQVNEMKRIIATLIFVLLFAATRTYWVIAQTQTKVCHR